ncbi:MAG: PAS domain-containing protein [Parachlamydiales bacterium]|nr:PAS domain-containing protein [Parachlamydiales bacterium]
MKKPPTYSLNRLSLKFAIIAFALTFVFGLLVIIGFLFDIPSLIFFKNDYTPVQFNTGLIFWVLSSLFLINLATKRFLLIKCSLAILTLCFCLIFLCEYIFKIDLGIDLLLVKHTSVNLNPFPGRPSPNGILGLFLASIASIIYSFNPQNRNWYSVSILLGIANVILGASAILGYAAKIPAAYCWSGLSHIALSTSIAIVVLGGGIVFSSIYFSVRQYVLLQKLIPAYVFIFFSGLTLFVSQVIYKDYSTKIMTLIEWETANIKEDLNSGLKTNIYAMDRMAKRRQIRPDMSNEEWLSDAKAYVQDTVGYKAILWLNAKHQIVSQVNSTDGELITDLSFIDFSEWRQLALGQKTMMLFRPDNQLFYSITPVITSTDLLGFYVTIIQTKEMMEYFLTDTFPDLLGVEIFYTNTLIYSRGVEFKPTDQKNFLSEKFKIYNLNWKINIWPTPKFLQENRYASIDVSILVGACITVLLTLMTYFGQNMLRVRKELEISRNRMDAILRGTNDFVGAVDAKMNFFALNPTFQREFKKFVGFEVQIGSNILDALKNHPRERAKARISLNRALMGKSYKATDSFGLPGLPAQHYEISFSPVISEHHEVLGASFIVKNITLIARAQEKLRISEERFHLATKATNDVIWDWDILKNEIWFNQIIEEFGYAIDPSLMDMDWLKEKIHPQDVEGLVASLDATLESDANEWSIEYRFRKADGSYAYVHNRGYIIRNEKKQAIRMIGALANISERKNMEKMRSEFVATVSHELRTPLTSIMSSLALIANNPSEPLGPKTLELLHIADNNCKRILHLVNDILDVEKIEAGKMEFTFKSHSIASLIKESVLANQPYAEKFGVHLHILEPLPDLKVNVDYYRLMQVLSNLLSNAIKFSPQDQIVTLSAFQTGKRVRVSIEDHGPGIPQNFRSQIFKKFSQADNLTARAMGGTGLGLNISKMMIEKMGGILDYETVIDSGSTFFFELPIFLEE